MREFLVKQKRHHKIQNAIAQKFQAFIVRCAKTAVRQGFFQNGWILKGITQHRMQSLIQFELV